MKNEHIFIGIDVSKLTLDICILNSSKKTFFKVGNKHHQILDFFIKHDYLNSKVCFENTGYYNRELINVLSDLNIPFYQINPLHLKKSLGLTRGKNDKIDSYRIAAFISKNHQDIPQSTKQELAVTQLKILLTKRNLLVKQRAQCKTSIKEFSFVTQLDLGELLEWDQQIINELSDKIKLIEKYIAKVIQQNKELYIKHKIATSIPGVGPVLSWHMLVKTDAYTTIKNPRKFACYAGVAPFRNQSGTSVYSASRVSIYADKAVKTLLHMAAMRAIRLNNDLKQYYHRKVKEGKNKMLVLNNIRNKIIHRIFAMIKNQNMYQFNLQVS